MNYTARQPAPAATREYPVDRAGSLPARTMRRAATLERNGPRVVKTASLAGVEIRCLGIAPLFDESRAYAGPQTDWIIRPAADRSDVVIPAGERERLQRLIQAGIDFPLVYVAHEIPKNRLALPAGTTDGAPSRPVTLDQATATEAVGPVPPPADASMAAERVGRSAQRLLTVIRTALPIAAGIAAAPIVVAAAPLIAAGAAIGALAAGLDPIVFGVIPAGDPVPGQPAVWYILAQWEWSAIPSEG